MRELSAKCVPKYPKEDRKRQRCQSSEQHLELFRREPIDFLLRLVTTDETWLYRYEPETKQHSMEWRHGGSPYPKKFRVQKSTGKALASNFLGSRRHPPIDHRPKGQTINVEYYSSVLVQLRDILREKRRGKFTKLVLSLHDNALAHLALATQKTLEYLSVQCLDHPPYYPDLGP